MKHGTGHDKWLIKNRYFREVGAMNRYGSTPMIAGLVVCFVLSATLCAQAATSCFAASRTYQIHPLRGGPDVKQGWSVRGEAFNQCVRQAEAADKTLRARYPETIYALSLASTIGCHNC
jgi:hypothetical protein